MKSKITGLFLGLIVSLVVSITGCQSFKALGGMGMAMGKVSLMTKYVDDSITTDQHSQLCVGIGVGSPIYVNSIDSSKKGTIDAGAFALIPPGRHTIEFGSSDPNLIAGGKGTIEYDFQPGEFYLIENSIDSPPLRFGSIRVTKSWIIISNKAQLLERSNQEWKEYWAKIFKSAEDEIAAYKTKNNKQ
jgi:hypothetical protein